jgi:hypothetical protein
VTAYSVTYDAQPHTAAGTATGVNSESLAGLNLSGTTHTNAGTYNGDAWSFTNANYNSQNGTVNDLITARAALVAYIGQQTFVTSGTSATTAQVTLSASMQDPTGLALAGATVDFIDLLTNTTLAKGVKVSPVAGSPANTGTANTIVTLSTGQFGSQTYEILVKLTANYDNTAQPQAAKTAAIAVMKPALTNQTIGAGTVAAAATAGRFASSSPALFQIGLAYNKSGANLQGQINLTIPQADGGFLFVKSNSISSMAVSGKTSVIYTKATVTRVLLDGTQVGIDAGVSFRIDSVDGAPDKVGFTVLSSKTSELYYSNNWTYDSPTAAWRTTPWQVATGAVTIN